MPKVSQRFVEKEQTCICLLKSQNFTDVCIEASTKRLEKLVDFGDLYANKTYNIVVVDVVVKRSRKECRYN